MPEVPKRKQRVKPGPKESELKKGKCPGKSGKAAEDSKAPNAKAKAKGKPRGRKACAPEESLTQSPLYSEKLAHQLMEFARAVGGEDVDHTSDAFKERVRKHAVGMKATALNAYWSRGTCGVKDLKRGKDMNHFSFSSSSAYDSYTCAVACKCAMLAVTWLIRDVMSQALH